MKSVFGFGRWNLFYGEAFGKTGEVVGEIVFNTCMTGYQEILTNPSYNGQIVAMTYPLIGNYGFNRMTTNPTESMFRDSLSKSFRTRPPTGVAKLLPKNISLQTELWESKALTQETSPNT